MSTMADNIGGTVYIQMFRSSTSPIGEILPLQRMVAVHGNWNTVKMISSRSKTY